MSSLVDQAGRDRFVQEQRRNISVIAPAGVGKTTSIVNRIVYLARRPEAEAIDRLSRLIVVTYSVRAAQQMQQKARVGIREARVPARVQRAFQQTFFGTIHSYCVRLLDRFGHYLGLPSPVGLLEDADECWERFLVRGVPPDVARDPHLRDLFAFYAPEKLYRLGREIAPDEVREPGPPPAVDIAPVLAFQDMALHPKTRQTIGDAQNALAAWSEVWARGERNRPPKPPASEAAADFRARWHEAFTPLHDWLGAAALSFGRRVANAYGTFRLREAVMTYEDQVRLALLVLDHPQARRELAQERISVLLDEAQDTDPRQFEVLRRVAGLGGEEPQADDQSFCIVGDFQQAIYAPRSDLGAYRRIHEEVSAEPRGTSSVLQVTFRCDTAVIDFVNRVFPQALDERDGQSRFETLVARDGAGPGQVLRWLCPDEPRHAAGDAITSEERATHEARFVARRLAELGPEALGAGGWSQVALLCPRREWLLRLRRELAAAGLRAQMHSADERGRERTAGAWLAALVWVAAHPEDTFEITGVLRDIFGVADADLARFTGGEGDKLRLDRPPFAGGAAVEAALDILREACAGADAMPLAQAVRRLVETTRLRERLRLVDEDGGADRDLDDALAAAGAHAADGATLAELAHDLRLGLARARQGEEEIRDEIQLMTSYKAKGLEWQAVIVPFVFRVIGTRTPVYPRVDRDALGAELVTRDKADYERRIGAFIERRELQQFQRLLYVAATRAKRTLVWIDDETLYAGQRRSGLASSGELLEFTPQGRNRAVWEALPEAHALPAEAAAPRETAPALAFELPDLAPDAVARALETATTFPRRVTPHALVVPPPEEAKPERATEQEEAAATADSPAILYGTWWHELVQGVPWAEPREEWQRRFTAALALSPQPKRSAREWRLFLDSPLAAWLEQPGRLVQVEWPFLSYGAEGTCIEGVMDLAVWSESDAAWHVIDWKTNRVSSGGAAAVVAMYRPQVRAYAEALGGMLSAPVRGSLYLTQTGAWEPVD